MIKHIFCDLDGTLYHNGISKEDIESIKIIEENFCKTLAFSPDFRYN